MKKVILCILDGVGVREVKKGNAFLNTSKKTFDFLWNNYPHSLLEASGEYVGLPNKQMGNSEVGHTNIGAGRIVYQSLELINKEIRDKKFFKNEELLNVIDHVKKNNSTLHIFGLLSDGGIHSHINHLYALLEMCRLNDVKSVMIHPFLDGRDTLPNVALKFFDELESKLENEKIGVISGRYYAMDRDNNWDRIKKVYDALVYGIGNRNNYRDAILECYDNNIFDEFITPTIVNEKKIEDNDGMILFNFRPDRARELFTALTNKDFNEFENKKFNNLKLVTMMPVADSVICTNAYKHENLINTLGEYIDNLGLKQLRIAETEKYAHVTYFFDGGVERDLKGSKRILIPSPSVKTYDLKPEMSAYLITDKLMEELDNNYDLVVLNYANGDMVGHTGNYDATSKAVLALDNCLDRLYKKALEDDYTLVIIADHGNCDYMLDDKDNVVTSHSVSPVPCIITDNNYKVNNGRLCDVAPTILNIMGIDIPKEMNGNSLIERRK
mgnify:FL=1